LLTSSGLLICYLIGAWVDWQWVNGIIAIIDGLLAILVWFVPESPAVSEEVVSDTILSRKWIFHVFIGCCFPFFQQMSGISPIVSNLLDLFTSSGVEINPAYASAIATTAKVITCFLAGPVIERFGRRPIWILSFTGMAATEVMYGLTQMPALNGKVAIPNYVPIIIIFLCMMAFGIGAGPIPWFIVPEMFPTSVRATAVAFAVTSNWIFTFVAIELFPQLKKWLGEAGAFIFFGGMGIAAAVFGFFFVKDPDTQARIRANDDMYYNLMSAQSLTQE
jgi:MFS family permease